MKVKGAELTAEDGVPVMAPVELLRASPAGRVPLVSDQEYGVFPPVAVSGALYAVPTWPFGRDAVAI